VVVENLGPRYPVVLAAADVVVGNSSSGVIEAASVGVPVVDVGDRQRGRLRGDNVVHADEGEAAVGAALDLALSPEHRARSAAAANPYGDGHAAGRVVDVVRAAPAAALAKPFVDAPEPR
jgi:UDP-N-acetylglucosamine 2-epimerase (non-hydrolysing)